MSDQHRQLHWDQDEPLQGSHFSSPGTETDEWNSTNETFDASLEPLSGKIVARMPDLGDCPTISPPSSSRFTFPLRFAGRLLSVGRPVVLVAGKTIARPFTRKRKNENSGNGTPLTETAPRAASRKPLYSRLIVIGMILLICGTVLTVKGIKKKQKRLARKAAAVAKAEAAAKNKAPVKKADEKKAATENTSVDKAAAAKAAKVAADKAAAEKAAKDKAAKEAAEKAAKDKAAAEKAAAEKAAKDKAAKEAADKAAKAAADKAAAEKAAKDKAAREAAEKAAKDPNSPWDRPATDGYSPWTMSSSQRLDAAAENAAKETQNAVGVAVTPAMPTTPAATTTPAPVGVSTQAVVATPPSPAEQGVPMMNVPVTVQQTVARPQSANPALPVPNGYPVQTAPQPMTAGPQQDPRGFASTSQFYRGAPASPASVGPGYVAAPVYPSTAQQYPYANYPVTPNVANRPAMTVAATQPAPGRLPITESPRTYQGASMPTSASPMMPANGYQVYQPQPVQPTYPTQSPQPVYVQTPQPVYGQPNQPVYAQPNQAVYGQPTPPIQAQAIPAQTQQQIPAITSTYQQATYQAPIPSGPATAYPTTPFYSTYPSSAVPAYQQGVPNGRIY